MTGDDDTITLKDAASHFGFSVYTLRTEADRGRLAIYKIGKRCRPAGGPPPGKAKKLPAVLRRPAVML